MIKPLCIYMHHNSAFFLLYTFSKIFVFYVMFVPFLYFVLVNFSTNLCSCPQHSFAHFPFHFPLTRSEHSATMGSLMRAIEPTAGPILAADRIPCWSLLLPAGLWPGTLTAGPCWSLCFDHIYSCPSHPIKNLICTEILCNLSNTGSSRGHHGSSPKYFESNSDFIHTSENFWEYHPSKDIRFWNSL